MDASSSASASMPFGDVALEGEARVVEAILQHPLVAGADEVGVARVRDEAEARAGEREVALVRLHRRRTHPLGQREVALVVVPFEDGRVLDEVDDLLQLVQRIRPLAERVEAVADRGAGAPRRPARPRPRAACRRTPRRSGSSRSARRRGSGAPASASRTGSRPRRASSGARRGARRASAPAARSAGRRPARPSTCRRTGCGRGRKALFDRCAVDLESRGTRRAVEKGRSTP